MQHNSLSREEVNFSRLLKKTEKLLLEYQEDLNSSDFNLEDDNFSSFIPDSVISNELTNFPGRCILFDRYLRRLNEQWKQLAANDSMENSNRLKRLHGGPPPSQMSLAAYRNKLDHLQHIFDNILEQEKERAEREPISSFGSSSSFRFDGESTSKKTTTDSVSNLLTEKDDLFSLNGEGPSYAELSVEDMIKKHRETQEQLTSEILMMVSALKDTNIKAFNIVAEDNSRLETVEQEVAGNIQLVSNSIFFYTKLKVNIICKNRLQQNIKNLKTKNQNLH